MMPLDFQPICEHQYFGPNPNFNWCPICGIRRPKPKTLAEKFFDRYSEGAMTRKEMMSDLADIAEQHYRESK